MMTVNDGNKHPSANESAPLISATELASLIAQPSVKVFDVRGIWGTPSLRDEYLEGHIPGAVFLDWTKEFLEPDVAINLASVASQDVARRSFQALGIDPGDRVILYDDYHHMFAARIRWAMNYWGFAKVSVLHGGWRHWVSWGMPTSQELPPVSVGTFEPERRDGLRLSLDQFITERVSACVIDARGPISYSGNPEEPRSGHIPGAVNVPFRSLLDEHSGLFLEPEALQRIFDGAIPGWREQRIISSCGAGYAGSVALLALEMLGIEATLFDGSFSVWKQDPDRVVIQSPPKSQP